MTEESNEERKKEPIGADEDLLCGMCHVTEMGKEPIAVLACRHAFHANCIRKVLKKKWAPNRRITFTFFNCPICKKEISLDYTVPMLNELVQLTLDEKTKKITQARQIAIEENLAGPGSRVATIGDRYY